MHDNMNTRGNYINLISYPIHVIYAKFGHHLLTRHFANCPHMSRSKHSPCCVSQDSSFLTRTTDVNSD